MFIPVTASAPLRCIVHVDMDAFYASVEQRGKPELRGQPVIVGGQPNSRGVVAAASSEARKFGVRSAMPSAQAYRLCPHGHFVRPRFHKYKAVSAQIMQIFDRFTPVIEPLSLDEAYLDLTGLTRTFEEARQVARAIKAAITQTTALTASAGIGPNKFLAKLASDMQKPDGLTVLDTEFVETVLPTLPVRTLPGIGRKTEERLAAKKILTVGDLRRHSLSELTSMFGSSAQWFMDIAWGIDDREVDSSGERKSLGAEDTFSRDISKLSELEFELSKLVVRVAERLLHRNLRGKTVTLKVKFANFKMITRQKPLARRTNRPDEILAAAQELFRTVPLGEQGVRLLGVSISGFTDQEPSTPDQLSLFTR